MIGQVTLNILMRDLNVFVTLIPRSPRKTKRFTYVKKFADERIGVEEFESRFSPIFDS